MATYSYEVIYSFNDMDDVEAETEQEARELIQEAWYACSQLSGYSMPWDEIEIVSLELEDEDDE